MQRKVGGEGGGGGTMFIIIISGNKIKRFETGKNNSKRAQQREVVAIVSL